MKSLLYIVLLCAISLNAFAGDIHARFSGSNFSGMTLESTVFETNMSTDPSNDNLIDISGENMIYSSEDLTSNWTLLRMTAPSADIMHEDATAANTHYMQHTVNSILSANTTYNITFEAKAISRSWISVQYEIGGNRVFFNIANGTVGTILGYDTTATIVALPGGWYRCTMTAKTGVADKPHIRVCEADNDDNFNGLDQDSLYIRRIRASRVTVDPMGQYHTTAGARRRRHDMTDAGTIVTVDSSFQKSEGNLHKANLGNGVNSAYSGAHYADFNIYDSDHTLTIVYMQESGHAGNDNILADADGSGGIILFSSATNGEVSIRYYQAGWANIELLSNPDPARDVYHVIQIVRSSNIAYLYIDNVLHDSTDVTGYGLDNAASFNILGSGIAGYLYGSVLYGRLDAEAVSDEKREEDYSKILAILVNTTRGSKLITFTRSTIGTIVSSTGTVVTHALNMPRVGGDGGGLLVESDVTQLHGFTEAFDSWINNANCAVTPNTVVAPDGTLTADRLDNTGGVSGDNRYIATANLGDLTGEIYTYPVWIRADTPHVVTLRVLEQGVANTYLYPRVTTEWQRVDVQVTMVGGGTGAIWVFVYPGQNGVATGIADFWGANLTETNYPVSYIANAGAATTQVTRNRDNAYLDMTDLVPESICATCQASKIKISFDAKAHWSGSADLDVYRYFLSVANSALPNYIYIRAQNTTGLFYTSITDSAGVTHSISSANDPVDYSDWHYYEIYFDTADLSNSYQRIDGVDTGSALTNMTGTCTFNLDATTPYLRLGTNWNGGTVTRLMGNIKNPHFHWE